MPLKLSIKIGIPWASFNEATKGLINVALHKHSPELGLMERISVRGRTPRLYGALKESVSSQDSKRRKTGPLTTLYFDDEPQLFEWHRVYAKYQEGPPIGIPGYTATGAPRHMLYDVLSEDANQIEEWAVRVAQTALDEWTAQAQAEADAKELLEAI